MKRTLIFKRYKSIPRGSFIPSFMLIEQISKVKVEQQAISCLGETFGANSRRQEAPSKECNKEQVVRVLYWISHVPSRRV